MRIKIITAFVCFHLLMSCRNNAEISGQVDSLKKVDKDSLKADKVLTSAEQMALGNGNGDNLPPSYEEEKKDLLSQYNKIVYIDTLFKVEDDTFRLLTKYYCLKDSVLIVPKKFAFGSQRPENFVTHNFAAKIMLLKDQDTLINMIVKKTNFSQFLDNKINRFGSLSSPHVTLDEKDHILIRFSVGIPLTDLATNVYLTINKDGSTYVKGE